MDINEIFFDKLFLFIAATESPPPTNEKAPFFVVFDTDLAILYVPFENSLISKTPIGPFHNIFFDFSIISLKALMDFGPISKFIIPFLILFK